MKRKTANKYLVFVLLLAIVVSFSIYYSGKLKKVEGSTEKVNSLNAEFISTDTNIKFLYPLKWQVKTVLKSQSFNLTKGERFIYEIDSQRGIKIQIEIVQKTPSELLQEEIEDINYKNMFYSWEDITSSELVQINTVDNFKVYRKSVASLKQQENSLKTLKIYNEIEDKITSQLRILNKNTNSDRINISYILNEKFDYYSYSKLEELLIKCDEVVKSFSLSNTQ